MIKPDYTSYVKKNQFTFLRNVVVYYCTVKLRNATPFCSAVYRENFDNIIKPQHLHSVYY